MQYVQYKPTPDETKDWQGNCKDELVRLSRRLHSRNQGIGIETTRLDVKSGAFEDVTFDA